MFTFERYKQQRVGRVDCAVMRHKFIIFGINNNEIWITS